MPLHLVAVGALLSLLLLAPAKAQANSTLSPTLTLDGVTVMVTSAVMPSPTFTVAAPGAVDQTAVSSTVEPYRDLTLEAIPFGTQSSGEGLPTASQGAAPTYRSELSSQRQSEGGAPQPAPAIDLFGVSTPGTVSQVSLAVSVAGQVPVAIAEWVGQAGPRLWIVRADEQLTGGETTASFTSLLRGTSVTSPTVAATPSPSPSATPSPAVTPTPAGTPTPSVNPSPSPSAPTPSPAASPIAATTQSLLVAAQPAETNAPWWNGVCDVGTNGDGYPLGAVFQGFAACGPRPFAESPAESEDYLVQFFPGAWGVYEFECVEMVMRYLYLTYGIDPYPANGNQTVTNYSGSRLAKVSNGTAGRSPQPGDILSFGADTADGHTAVVTSNDVNTSGNGSITVIEENNSASGSNTLTVSNWVVGPDAYPTIGWLSNPSDGLSASDGPSVAVNPANGEQYVYWQASDGGLRQDYGTRAAANGPISLGMGTVGSVVTAGTHSDGEVDAFWKGASGDLLEAFWAYNRWNGPYDQGPGWNLGSEPSVAIDPSNGDENVFWQGQDGTLWEGYWDGTGWHGPVWLGMGTLGSAPTAAAHASGEFDVFWRGANGDLWEAFWAYNQWNGPYDQGPGWDIDSKPSVAVNQSNGDTYVFWQGPGGTLLESYWSTAGWDGPTPLNMSPLASGSAPAVGVESDGEVDVFWRGANGDLSSASWSGGRWYGPYDQGSGWDLTADPSMTVVQSNGQQDVFWQGPGGGLWEGYWAPGSWTGPTALQMGTLGSVPTAAVHSNGERDVFWEGTNGDLWEAFWAYNTWNGPYDEGPGWNVNSEPSVTVSPSNGYTYVFWQGSDGSLYEGYWSGTGWSGPISLGMGELGSAPAAVARPNGEIDVFWKGTNGDLWGTVSNSGVWGGPYDRGAGWNLGSGPSVAMSPKGGLEYVFWRGNDGGLWEGYSDGMNWNGPLSAGMGELASAPAVGVQPDGEIDVYWRAPNADVGKAYWTNNLWNGPYDLGPGWNE